MTDGDKKTEKSEGVDFAAKQSPAKEKKRKSKQRMSASEYQQYILMEQGNVEVDSQGSPSLAEQEEPTMLIRLPSWLAISEDSKTSPSKDVSENYINMEKQPQKAPKEYMKPPTRWQRYKAEFCDLFHELLNYGKKKSWKKKVLTVIVCACSFLVFADLLFFGNIARWLQAFIFWMGNNIILGIFAFIGLFVVATLVFVPPTILTFGCGYICAEVLGTFPGIVAATMACFIGSVVGAVIAFFRARYMMRDLVRLFAKRYTIIRATDRAIKRHGFRVMLLLRLCPLIPFHALNYIGGITAVRWEAFTLSMIGMLPIQILTVTTGATTSSLVSSAGSEDEQLVHIVLVCSGLAFTIIAFCIILYFARKELNAELEAAKLMESSAELKPQEDEKEEEEDLTHLGIEHGIDDEAWFWLWV